MARGLKIYCMADFEDLRLADLIEKFRLQLDIIAVSGSLEKLRGAAVPLQNIYNFYVTAKNSFSEQEEYLKALFSSFNYAAVIANNAVKCGQLSESDKRLLSECVEVMQKSCTALVTSLRAG